MEKIPIDTNLIPKKRPRQSQAIALLQEMPRTKEELAELMNTEKSNLKKILQALISKGEIIPNPTTGKYQIHNQ